MAPPLSAGFGGPPPGQGSSGASSHHHMVPSLVPSGALGTARVPFSSSEEPSWVGAREEASPAARLCSPGASPNPLMPPRPDGTRRCGAGCAPSEGVTSSGSLPAGFPPPNLLRPRPRPRPRPRSLCHRRCSPQPPGSRAGSAQAGKEGPLPGEGRAGRGGAESGAGLVGSRDSGWKRHRACRGLELTPPTINSL